MTTIITRMHIIGEATTEHATIVTRINEDDDGSFKWWCICGVGSDELTFYRRASREAHQHRESYKEHYFAKPLNPLYKKINE